MDRKKVNDQLNIKRIREEQAEVTPVATINVIYTPVGGGYHIDIKCTNAHLIGTGRSERIASKIRKEIHRQRYHQMTPEAA
jgi:hypothetical protein